MKEKQRKATADAALDAFEFEDAGRTFTCSREAPRAARPDGWWWFSVTPDARGQRYAPFRAAPEDTRATVQARIVAYYDELLARRAAPPAPNQWGRRAVVAPAADSAAPAVPAEGGTAGTAGSPG